VNALLRFLHVAQAVIDATHEAEALWRRVATAGQHREAGHYSRPLAVLCGGVKQEALAALVALHFPAERGLQLLEGVTELCRRVAWGDDGLGWDGPLRRRLLSPGGPPGDVIPPAAGSDWEALLEGLTAARDGLIDQLCARLRDLGMYAAVGVPSAEPTPGPAPAPATPADEGEGLPPARHSDDFCSVHWYGTDYVFTTTQRGCVRLLWKALDNGTPILSQQYILEHPDVEAESSRLSDLFKNHPAWGTMIVPGGSAGTFQLRRPHPAA
jgi:hypothetical protein